MTENVLKYQKLPCKNEGLAVILLYQTWAGLRSFKIPFSVSRGLLEIELIGV